MIYFWIFTFEPSFLTMYRNTILGIQLHKTNRYLIFPKKIKKSLKKGGSEVFMLNPLNSLQSNPNLNSCHVQTENKQILRSTHLQHQDMQFVWKEEMTGSSHDAIPQKFLRWWPLHATSAVFHFTLSSFWPPNPHIWFHFLSCKGPAVGLSHLVAHV